MAYETDGNALVKHCLCSPSISPEHDLLLQLLAQECNLVAALPSCYFGIVPETLCIRMNILSKFFAKMISSCCSRRKHVADGL